MALLRNYSLAQLIGLLTDQGIGDSTFHLGYFTVESRFLPYPYRLQGYAIGLCSSGWLKASLNLEMFRVNAGQLMIIAPQQIHRIESCSRDFVMKSLFFTDAFLASVLREPTQVAKLPIFQPNSPAVLNLTDREFHRINALINVIEQYYWPADSAAQLTVRYVLQALLTDLSQIYEKVNLAQPKSAPGSRPVELASQFRQLVTSHYLTTRNVSDYADLLAVSTKHLSETVKAQTGQPAGDWIDAMVLQEAQVLLSQTTNTLSQIADYLQFSTQSAFGKFFRQQTGVSPKEYRNNR